MFVIILLLITFFGYLLITFLDKNKYFNERIFLGFLLGNGVYVFLIFIMNWIGVNNNQLSFILLLLCLIIIGLAANILHKTKALQPLKFWNILDKKRIGNIKISVFLLGIVPLVLFVFISDLYWPVKNWDSITLYDFLAKIFYKEGNIISALQMLNQTMYVNYPFFVTNTHLWIYVFGGQNPMFIHFIFYLSFLVVMYYLFLDISRNRNLSMLATLFVAVDYEIFFHSTIAYSNLPYLIFFDIGIITIYKSLINKKISLIILGAVFVGVSTFIRNEEPLWIIPFMIIISWLLLLRKKNRDKYSKYYPFLYLIIVSPFIVLWNVFQSSLIGSNNTFKIINYLESINLLSITGIIVDVSKHFWLSSLKYDFVLIVAFLFSIYFARKNRLRIHIFLQLMIIVVLYVILYLGSFILRLFYGYEHWLSLSDSLSRISMLFTPLLIYFLVNNMVKRKSDE